MLTDGNVVLRRTNSRLIWMEFQVLSLFRENMLVNGFENWKSWRGLKLLQLLFICALIKTCYTYFSKNISQKANKNQPFFYYPNIYHTLKLHYSRTIFHEQQTNCGTNYTYSSLQSLCQIGQKTLSGDRDEVLFRTWRIIIINDVPIVGNNTVKLLDEWKVFK